MILKNKFKKIIYLIKIIMKWIFICTIKKVDFNEKKQVILTFIKSKFETQLYIISNIKGKSYLIIKMVFSKQKTKITTMSNKF